jgi:hypothetical protein
MNALNFIQFIAANLAALTSQLKFKRLPADLIQIIAEEPQFVFNVESYNFSKEIQNEREAFMRTFKRIVLKSFTQLSTEQFQDFTRYIDDDDLAEAGNVVLPLSFKAA